MKKQLLTLLLSTITFISVAQTATNFTANDCNGTSHNLFTELNSGKVIVLCWVMPCASCVGPSLTTNNVVGSYTVSNPNRVFMYLCDDYANTNCSSLSSWANSNGISNALRFSNASINMNDYGTTGMPMIVVLGGANHTVFYTATNSVNATALQSAINSALNATGLQEENSNTSMLNIFPNPANNNAEINFTLKKPSPVNIELYTLEGKMIQKILTGNQSAGENKIQFSTNNYPAGMYLVKLSDALESKFINLSIVH